MDRRQVVRRHQDSVSHREMIEPGRANQEIQFVRSRWEIDGEHRMRMRYSVARCC